jgi:hypothetical protein
MYILFSSTPSYVKRVSHLSNVIRIKGDNRTGDVRATMEVKLGEA